MIKDFFLLAFMNIRHKGLRSWLTIIGILIGIAAVVSLISLSNGFKMAINSQFGISSTEVLSVQAGGINSVGPPGTGVARPLTEDDMRAIALINGVKRATKRNIETGKVEFNDKTIIGYVTNIPDGEDRDFVYEQVELEAETGRLLKDGDIKKVFLGNNYLEDKMGFDKKVLPGNKIRIMDEEFEVIGISIKKGSFIFDNVIYMNENDAKKLFDSGDDIDVIAVQVKDPSLMDDVKEDIEKLLRKRRNVKEGEEDFEVSTPEAALETVNSILVGVQAFIIIIAMMSIIVGAIGIINTMTTSVLERKQEIGIMKAIGAKNSHIFTIFFIESGLMGLIGGIIGVTLGISIGYIGTIQLNNFIGSSMSPDLNIMLISLTLIGSFVIGSIAGIAPAMQAARHNPVEALRG